jgi:hypothetical protein
VEDSRYELSSPTFGVEMPRIISEWESALRSLRRTNRATRATTVIAKGVNRAGLVLNPRAELICYMERLYGKEKGVL